MRSTGYPGISLLATSYSPVRKVRGGKLKARKGVNVPTVQIDCAALTEKDIEAWDDGVWVLS